MYESTPNNFEIRANCISAKSVYNFSPIQNERMGFAWLSITANLLTLSANIYSFQDTRQLTAFPKMSRSKLHSSNFLAEKNQNSR